MKDYYKILGVQENATDDDIKKAYRRLSKEYHPDVNPEGAEKFKEIAEAYENISTQEKREQLKNQGRFTNRGFEDMFRDIFGGMDPRFRKPSVPDKIVSLTINPFQSFLGESVSLNYFRNIICATCTGAGGNRKICNSCSGVGYHSMVTGSGFFRQEVRKVCDDCKGQGFQLLSTCHACDAKGYKPTAESIKITIPVGTDDGHFLKLQGMGDYRDGFYGNLVIQIRMISQDGYEKMNNDLIYNKFLSLEDLKNDSIVVKHPQSDIKIDLPQEFDTSKPLRVRGKGFNGGDFYIRLNLKIDRSQLQSK